MKFLGGFITGVVTTILVLISMSGDVQTGLTMSPEKGECITKKDLVVFQALETDMALARCGKSIDDQLVLLISYDGKQYYDGQVIPIPSGMCARQVGTYHYTTKMDMPKTIPAVTIE